MFLDLPEVGDLHDTCAVDEETTFDNFVLQSGDSVEAGRRRIGSTSFVIDWMPKSPVTPYALYEHEYSWFPAGSQLQPALYSEYRCAGKTGHFLCEWITPQALAVAETSSDEEAPVAPGWEKLDERLYGAARVTFLKQV